MTKLKGFWKNRYNRSKPVLYNVEFETGHIEQVNAVNNWDAKQKTAHLSSDYGLIIHIYHKKSRLG